MRIKKVIASLFLLALTVLAFLLSAQIRPVVAAGDLITHWQFDETTAGATVADTSGSGFDGTPHGVHNGSNNPSYLPQPSTDVPTVSYSDPRSLFFQGNGGNSTGSYVDVSNWNVDTSNGFTVALWAKPETTSGSSWERFFDFGNGPGSDNIVFAQNGGNNQVYFEVYNGGSTTKIIGSNGTWMVGSWHYYAATIDANGNADVYVDGNIVASGTTNKPVNITRTNKYIGKSNWGDDYYEGYMDDLRIYGRALSQSEVTNLTNGDSGPGVPPALTTLTPADNATGVAITSDITLHFDKAVTASSGAVTIYKASDNSVVESIAANSGQVSGSGTDTITLNPTNDLAYNSDYYVKVGSDAFKDASNTFFGGIADATTWNFTTVTNDNDNDGITNAVEDAAPNGGDGNNDGTPDKTQSNVTSFVDSVTNNYATVAVDNACTLTSLSGQNQSGTTDGDYSYPLGLLNFTANCGTPGFTTTVTEYYYDPPTDTFVLRKLINSTYQTISGATITRQSIGGHQVLVVSYPVTDGSSLDADGLKNGIIVDPAGPAVLAVSATPTPIPTATSVSELAVSTPTSTPTPSSTPALSAPNTGLQKVTMLTYVLALLIGLALLGSALPTFRGFLYDIFKKQK